MHYNWYFPKVLNLSRPICCLHSGQDLIDSWIHKKNVDDLLTECEIQDEVSNTSFSGYNRELSRRHQDSSRLFDSSHNYFKEDETEVRKPGN